MPEAYLSGKTLDDLMRSVIVEIRAHGDQIRPSKGAAKEITGVLLELTNPRARLSLTETRGKPYSCLGELCWYLAGTKGLDFISYYIPRYKNYADGVEVFGGYGPRLFNWENLSQMAVVISLLKKKPDSRQAVIQLFDRHDIVEKHEDVPCTCTIQFMLRRGRLHMFTNMRSNDAFVGMPHDFFCFTMLQEIVARSLSAELGTYKHAVGSLHIYDSDVGATEQFLEEGWQPTDVLMPQMPFGDPWPSVALLLEAEASIRDAGVFDGHALDKIDQYWLDLIWLLQVFWCKQKKDVNGVKEAQRRVSSSVYFPFIDKVIDQLA
jgi:thymidylate synthase